MLTVLFNVFDLIVSMFSSFLNIVAVIIIIFFSLSDRHFCAHTHTTIHTFNAIDFRFYHFFLSFVFGMKRRKKNSFFLPSIKNKLCYMFIALNLVSRKDNCGISSKFNVNLTFFSHFRSSLFLIPSVSHIYKHFHQSLQLICVAMHIQSLSVIFPFCCGY